MNYPRLGLFAALAVLASIPAGAQTVSIQFKDGLVTIRSQNAPVRTILAEWARVGGAKIVNGDRVVSTPMTLELTNVPERQALDVLLRGVSGYIAGARDVASSGASSLDRIFILPTSAPPRTAAVSPPGRPNSRPPTFAPPPSPVVFVPGDPEEDPPDDVAPDQFTPLAAQQRLRQAAERAAAQREAEAEGQGDEEPDADEPPPSAPVPSPGNPFGNIQGSSRPGEISPAPQQRRRNPLRPNGDPEP